MNYKYLSAVSLSLALVACSNTPSVVELDDSRWYMTGEYYQIADIALPAFTLEKNDLGYKIAGTTGCNQFFGQANFDGQYLNVDQDLASTRKLCSETSNEIESEFMQAIKDGFELKDQQLVLSNGAIMKQVPKS